MDLLISFTDQSPSFTNGVEFGRLLAQMESGAAVVENKNFPVHAENTDVLRRAAKQYGYTALFGPCADNHGNKYPEWASFRAVRAPLPN
jgi:hypothetical protein